MEKEKPFKGNPPTVDIIINQLSQEFKNTLTKTMREEKSRYLEQHNETRANEY